MTSRWVPLLILLSTTGCPYTFPKPNEPHAIVKIRRTYHQTRGEELREVALIDHHIALRREVYSRQASVPVTDAIRVHPRAAEWQWSGTFFHVEIRRVEERYTAIESCTKRENRLQPDGTYRFETVITTCYVEKTRWVNKREEVRDGNCVHRFTLAPLVGHLYLLQLSYMGGNICNLVCLEQIRAGAALQLMPCAPSVYVRPNS